MFLTGATPSFMNLMQRSQAFSAINVLLSLTHELLPVPESASVLDKDLMMCAKRAGVSKIGFLRHGKTGPAPEGGVDFDRLLTQEGKEQATSAGLSFGKDLLPFHNKILVSPAPRTMETAQRFLDASGVAELVQVQPVQGLYDGTMQPEGNVLFQKIGYAPLNDYVNSKNEDDRKASRLVLGSYAHFASQSILEELSAAADMECAETTKTRALWVVGHAIYLPSAALSVASKVGCDEESANIILSTSTQEAEGYLIDLDTATVAYLSRDQA